MAFERLIFALSISLVLLSLPVYSQINAPCTSSMLTSFTPCLNFVTNSSSNATSPTSDCCNALKTFMTNGTGCLCLIATGSVPFNIPINRSLALSLPRSCNQPGVPLQCKASITPAPAPGPLASGLSPAAAPSPTDSVIPLGGSPTLAPEAETTPSLTPSSSTTNSGSSPPGNSGNRQSVTPSAASTTLSFSPVLLLAVFVAIALKNY
ncbi:hypothetical protein ACH5RR_033255 [Cinchona calisaya]|uniref:Bifunctional inhibitor/plant lipid transfer protein/seed storage helical domain-containing protein n=1 Tax=Cinchona calisaya TaxID=153742 RepID=A0ABD2YQQ0_9GENT